MSDSARLCEFCGDEMEPMKYRGSPKRFCGSDCQRRARDADPVRRERRNEMERNRARAKAAEREASRPPRPVCAHCGDALAQRREGWRYCSAAPCRAAKKAEAWRSNPLCSVGGCERGTLARGYCPSHYQSEYRIPKFGMPPKKMKVRICVCGAEVESRAGKQKYCSDLCRYQWRDVKRADGKSVVVWEPPLHIPVVRTPRVVVLPPKQSRRFGCACVVCGVSFVADGMHITCSPECYRANKREKVKRNTRKYLRRHGKFAIEPSVRWSIYERDGWLCQLCGGDVSRVYDQHDPMSPTLDHVVPRSLQLVPDHSPSNLRLAHALCNSRRSNNISWASDSVLTA